MKKLSGKGYRESLYRTRPRGRRGEVEPSGTPFGQKFRKGGNLKEQEGDVCRPKSGKNGHIGGDPTEM